MTDHPWRAERRFSVRLKTLEINSCDENLLGKKRQNCAEISQWSEGWKSRWVIAHFVPTAEGFDLRFVGKRPLESDWGEFRQAVELGFQLLDVSTPDTRDRSEGDVT